MSMNNWLQNIKGQLTDLATEVLHEAREEVEDPETELQVEKRKCAEAQRLHLSEKSRSESLEKKVQELEDQLYSTNIENDAIKEKFEHIISDRDSQIKILQTEIERLRFHKDESDGFRSIDLDSSSTYKSGSSPRTKDQTATTHDELAQLKTKHEHEISALISLNNANVNREVNRIREEYEKRLQELESWNLSSSDADSSKFVELRAERIELEESIMSAQVQLEEKQKEIASLDKDIATKLDKLLELESYRENTVAQREPEESMKDKQSEECEKLKSLNAELLSAYNELYVQFEEYKVKHSAATATNEDLRMRIAALQTQQIECEDRYELCKMEHNETAAQLERLTGDFERLRSSVQSSRSVVDSSEQRLGNEITALRDALNQAKVERDKVFAEVANFRESVVSIDVELRELRERNHKLVQENSELSESLAHYEAIQEQLNAANRDLGVFREKLSLVQDEHARQIIQITEERDSLQRQLDQLQQQQCPTNTGNESDATDVCGLDTSILSIQIAPEPEESIEKREQEKTELLEQIAQLRQQLLTKENELSKARIVAVVDTAGQRSPSDADCAESGSADSNNDWERMGAPDWSGEHNPEPELLTSAISGETSSGGSESSAPALLDEGSSEVKQSILSKGPTLHEEHRGEAMERVEEVRVKLVQAEEELVKAFAKIAELEMALSGERELTDAERKRVSALQEEMAQKECNFFVAKADLDDLLERTRGELNGNFDERDMLIEKLAKIEMELAAKKAELRETMEVLTLERQRTEINAESVQSERTRELELFRAEKLRLEQRIGELETQLSTLGLSLEQNAADKAVVNEVSERLTQATVTNDELRVLLQTKHEECRKYYEKLQQFATSHQEIEQKLRNAEECLAKSGQELNISQETTVKLNGELTRLREHLMAVEEVSAKESITEAIAAEERETDLRSLVRTLQQSASNDSESTTNTLTQLKKQVSMLEAEVGSLDATNEQLHRELTERNESLARERSTVTSLQVILKELAEDQKLEKEQFERELRAIREEMEKSSFETEGFATLKAQFAEERRFLEDSVETLKEELVNKQEIIEELENQLEDLRHSNSTSTSVRGTEENQQQSSGSSSSYRIDDGTLRQLFLSYFTSDKSKQPEIASVMARILGYSPEEQSQIQQAITPSIGRSWFGFGGGSSSSNTSALSLTEQFIRFLEQESRVSDPSMVMPVQYEGLSEHGGRILMNESLFPVVQDSHSSMDLRSILEDSHS